MAESEATQAVLEPGADPPAGSEPDEKKHRGNYVLLVSTDDGETWTKAGEYEASGKASALSHFYENRPIPEPEEGLETLFQAIPAKSWKPLKPAAPRPRVPFSEV